MYRAQLSDGEQIDCDDYEFGERGATLDRWRRRPRTYPESRRVRDSADDGGPTRTR